MEGIDFQGGLEVNDKQRKKRERKLALQDFYSKIKRLIGKTKHPELEAPDEP